MTAARIIPDSVTRRQAEASDPSAAAFVAANAGSGKTHVLAQRVIRLLLDGGIGGVDPAKILCITFTKAAAANMAARVYDTLRGWIALDDAALDAALRAIGVTGIDAAKRARARRLFAAALDTPGGLKVQTIHAFCTRILQRFPFEANASARFTVLEERAQDEMLERATLGVLLEAAGAPKARLGGRWRPRSRPPPNPPCARRFAKPSASAQRCGCGSMRPATSIAPWRNCRKRSGSRPTMISPVSNGRSSIGRSCP